MASKASRLVTMLPSSPNVVDCYTHPSNGLFSTLQSGSLILDSSTIDPLVSKDMAKLAEAKNSVYMDSPVSGGKFT